MERVEWCSEEELMDIARQFGAVAAWEDEGTGLVKVLLRGKSFNSRGCLATLADGHGNRLTQVEFDYLGDSSDGLFEVHVPGGKFGYLDPNGQFAVKPIYDWTQEFGEGLAWVIRDGRRLIVDKTGVEIVPESLPCGDYMEVHPFQHGRARVSIFDFRDGIGFKFGALAYHHDADFNAGIWGYVDTAGMIVVPPQYIFAEDFCGGLAVVCKGEWTRDKKWDNEYNQGRLWSERMDWGAIDRDGREVIPCKFQEIKWRPFDESLEWRAQSEIAKHYLAAQDESGLWGLIDFQGKWVVKPQFGDMGYESDSSPNGDMFVFYSRDIWGGGDPDETPCGVYSVSRQQIIIPADKYVEIEFVDDRTVEVRETPSGPTKTLRLWNDHVSELQPPPESKT